MEVDKMKDWMGQYLRPEYRRFDYDIWKEEQLHNVEWEIVIRSIRKVKSRLKKCKNTERLITLLTDIESSIKLIGYGDVQKCDVDELICRFTTFHFVRLKIQSNLKTLQYDLDKVEQILLEYISQNTSYFGKTEL